MNVARVKQKVIKLRQKASYGLSVEYEPLRLFKEIEKDPKCRNLLTKVSEATAEQILHYNEHVRQSKLSKEDKEDLII